MATSVPDGAVKEDAGSVEELTHALNTVVSVVCVTIAITNDHRA